MANKKEIELERHAILLDMAGKIDVIFEILRQATIGTEAPKEEVSERKTRKKTAKAD